MINQRTIRQLLSSVAQSWNARTAVGPSPKRSLNLALQGGGAHGAFTWGVLDALLSESDLEFDAISGSSAGAINAAVMTHGWIQGGRDGARQALSDFWLAVGRQMPWPMITQGFPESMGLTPAAKLFGNWVGMLSPSNINPLAINPLRDVLNNTVDCERIRASSPFQMFIGATHVNSGKLRLFREHELTVDMLLASTCLPKIHHTVVIDGEPYWDGGYSANPAIFPLVQQHLSRDILLILLTPRLHDHTPTSGEEIDTRIQELGFKTHFLREMHLYAQAAANRTAGVADKCSETARGDAPRFHLIDANTLGVVQRSDTKLLAYTPFLEMLRNHGQEQAKRWLSQHALAIGTSGSVDLSQWLN